jgi:nitrogen fixation protein FixH
VANDRPAVKPPSGLVWPLMVVAMLAAQLALGGAAAYLATRDPAHAVTPGYHAKALAWDGEAQRRTASDALGWTAKADFKDGAVHVSLADRNGKPISNATVHAVVFHHARASDVRRVELQADKDGGYSAPFTMDRRGVWEIRLVAQRGADEFLWTESRDHSLGGSP